MSDDATVEFVTLIKRSPDSRDINSLHYHVQDRLKEVMYRNQKEPFKSLELLQKMNLKSLTFQDKASHRKVQAAAHGDWDLIQH
jgi:hypothetical protein